MKVFAASVSYQNTDNQKFCQIVGVFSSAVLAQQAITDFTESVLLQEYPDCKQIESEITKCEFNQPLFA